jgi:hypothetical protein
MAEKVRIDLRNNTIYVGFKRPKSIGMIRQPAVKKVLRELTLQATIVLFYLSKNLIGFSI